MARVQVQDLPDAPGLQPTVRSGGQYGVAVQQAGRNKLMDLADALSTVNPMLKDYAGIQRVQGAIGEQDAMKVSDADVMGQIKGSRSSGGSLSQALGIENRNRAFRNTLIKRAVNNDLLPAMKAESDTLLDVEKYKDNKAFLQAVDDFTKQKWEDFAGQIGEEAATSDGAAVVWNSITGPFKADMLAAYDKKKEDFIEYAQEEETGLELDAFTQKQIDPSSGQVIPFDPAGLGKIAQNREKLMKEAGITDKKTRNVILLNSYARQVDALIAKGRYSDAERMLAAMSVIQVNGKPVFRTTDAKTAITPLISKLNIARKTAGTTSDADARRLESDKAERFSNSVVNTASNLRAVDSREEATDLDIKEIGDTFRRLGVPEADINGLVDQVFTGPGKPMTQFQQVLRQAANNPNYPDIVNERYYSNVDNIDRGFEASANRPIRASALTPEDIADETKILQDYLEKNPTKTWQEFERTRNYKLPDEMKTFGDNFVKGNYVFNMDEYKNVEPSLDARLDAILDEEEFDDLSSGEGRAFLESNAVFVKERVERKAVEVADLPKEERDQAIRDELKAALDEEEARFRARMNAKTSALAPNQRLRPEQVESIEKEGVAIRDDLTPYIFSENKDFKYPTLMLADRFDNPSVSQADVDADRKKMRDREKKANSSEKLLIKAQLKRSLYRFGYNSWNPESVEVMEEAGMDADDVRLFKDDAELRDIAIGWDEIMQKDERGETLTEEEKETRALFNKLGIYNEETLQIFYSAQTALLGR
jgi:hypothetical protein